MKSSRHFFNQLFSRTSPDFCPGMPLRSVSMTVGAARHCHGAIDAGLSDHTIFNRIYTDVLLPNGKRMLVPGKMSPTWGQVIRYTSITTYNTAMRSLKRGPGPLDFNTGLNMNESIEAYEERMYKNGILFGKAAIKSSIGNVLEGPIHLQGQIRFQEGLDHASKDRFKIEDVTKWGVLTISNREFLPKGMLRRSIRSFNEHNLESRIVMFKIPSYGTRFTTLHLPHGNPKEALTVYVNSIAENISRAIEKGHLTSTQVCSGDFNLPPDVIEMEVRQKLENLFPSDLKMQLQSSIYYNEKGHLRTNGSFITVDASVSVLLQIDPMHLSYAQDLVSLQREKDCPKLAYQP